MQEVHLLGAEGKKTWCRWPIFSALFGAAAAWLFQTRTDRLRRWACIIGLAAQPFFAASLWHFPPWGLQVAVVSALGWTWGAG